MSALQAAMARWELRGTAQLIPRPDNFIYRIATANGQYAMRFHREGERSLAELESEVLLLQALDRKERFGPEPVPAADGHYVQEIDDTYVDVTRWIDGSAFLPFEKNCEAFGHTIGQFHNALDQWTLPREFRRSHRDVDGLLGETPLWGRFWDIDGLSAEHRSLFSTLREVLLGKLSSLDLDFGLIHGNLIPDNALHARHSIVFLNYNDCGHGYRLFDLAVALRKIIPPEHHKIAIEGYQKARDIDVSALAEMHVLSAAAFVGLSFQRRKESLARHHRLVHELSEQAKAYLGPTSGYGRSHYAVA